jgi:hypothetical protein
VAISDDEAAELARRLRAHEDRNGLDVAARLERALAIGTGVIATDPSQGRAVRSAIEGWAPERLREVARLLRAIDEWH